MNVRRALVDREINRKKQSSAPEMFPDECRQIPEGNQRHTLSFFLHIVNRLSEQMEEG